MRMICTLEWEHPVEALASSQNFCTKFIRNLRPFPVYCLYLLRMSMTSQCLTGLPRMEDMPLLYFNQWFSENPSHLNWYERSENIILKYSFIYQDALISASKWFDPSTPGNEMAGWKRSRTNFCQCCWPHISWSGIISSYQQFFYKANFTRY